MPIRTSKTSSLHAALYVHQKNPLDATRQGQCVFWINNKPMADVEDLLLNGEQGKELWLSHLSKHDLVLFGVFWEQEDPQINYATIEIKSDKGTHTNIWKSLHAEWFFKTRPLAERARYFRELSLDDVCATYTTETLKGLEFPKS